MPRILKYFRDVEVTEGKASDYEASNDPVDRRLAEVLRWRLRDASHQQSNDIYLLTRPEDEATLLLDDHIRHDGRGAWVQGQRYTSSDRLRNVRNTSELN